MSPPNDPPNDPRNDPMADPAADARSPSDVGPDLLAYIRGELDAPRAAELERLLAESVALRDEHARLAADHAAWTEALAAESPEPRRETLDALLAAVAEEAASRRAAATEAVSSSAGAASLRSPSEADASGAEVVALALDELSGAERDHAEALLAATPELSRDHDDARAFAAATRTALALEPRPETLQALLAQVATVGPAPVHFDTQDVPAPSHRRPGRLRLLGWLAPLAAAAVLVVALQPTPVGTAHVREGIAVLGHSNGDDGTGRESRRLDAASGDFDLDYGDVIGARGGPLTFRVACGEDAGAPEMDGPLGAGTAEFTLEPGARLARIDAAHFELLEGRIRVAAHELGERLEVRSGALYAMVTGTRFDATAVDERLFVIVEEGTVRLGRRGSDAASVELHAGRQGMVDADRLVSCPLDGRTNGDVFLTPTALLSGPSDAIRQGVALELEARLAVGEGGPVTIAAFDASVPLFLVRLKGPEGREHEIKVQESMLTAPSPIDSAPDFARDGAWRLTRETPYVLHLRISELELEPGRWEARLRYMSYRTRTKSTRDEASPEVDPPASPWLGATQSAPFSFEVTDR